MKAAVFYLSRTGNTKRFAQAISDSLKIPSFDVTLTKPESTIDYDLLIIGTPVNGFRPCPEVISFIQKLPEGANKNTILFCTYAIAKGSTLKILEQELSKKGYRNLSSVSKKGVKPNNSDFLEAIKEIDKCVEKSRTQSSFA